MSNTRDKLAEELRGLLLNAAKEAGSDTSEIADNIAGQVETTLGARLKDIADGMKPPPIQHDLKLKEEDFETLAKRIADVQARRDAERAKHSKSDSDGFFTEERLQGALLGALLASMLLVGVWWLAGKDAGSAAASAGLASPAEQNEDQAAPAAGTADEADVASAKWDDIEGSMPWGPNFIRGLACGTEVPGSNCDAWPGVRENLRDGWGDNREYVVQFVREVAALTSCDSGTIDAQEGDPVEPLLEIAEDCLLGEG